MDAVLNNFMENAFENELHEVYDRTGLKGLNEYITNELNRWKHERITMAITGNSGAGKSSLINALRGIESNDDNAAEEGVTETTKEIKPYSFPLNEQIRLYDLPGAGTKSHPIESYARDMDFKQKTQTRDAVLDKIRKDCLSNLDELNVKGNDVFLVSSHVHEDFELGKLQMNIANNASEALKTSLIFSYRNKTKEVIEGKIQYLQKRALMVAVKAVVSTVPGAEYLMNENVIIDEITFYKEELGLDDESLIKTCEIVGVDMKTIKNMISFTDFESCTDNIMKIVLEMDDKLDFKKLCKGILQTIFQSTFTGCRKSFVKVFRALCTILETLHLEALEILEQILEKERQ
ncbi:interferon-inducible GTPase 5-like [Ruditapes philippinarum]|uniref:interferon-inducible GTPase 5-like n=1 Tax=Ruditapes philippinarum TaxID=129788 RepID=UPI00295B0A29|nr:interferon-inducible GTPase 5-like [Ruditapes philippinarum]